jgi:hypothetical protein
MTRIVCGEVAIEWRGTDAYVPGMLVPSANLDDLAACVAKAIEIRNLSEGSKDGK